MDIPLKVVAQGLRCIPGDFFIDAWKPVDVCVVTHAHGDHAYWGHKKYIASPETAVIIKHRLGQDTNVEVLNYNQKIRLGNTWVSLHPAGHILGSSQVRIESPNGVTVISGDYKRDHDETCLPFEVVECDIFVTESTFALPIYQWSESTVIGDQIIDWWNENASSGHASVLFAYTLGKSQRILSLLKKADRPIYLHGATYNISEIYKDLGVPLPDFIPVSETKKGTSFGQEMILAPTSAMNTPWLKRFGNDRTAFASGWMQARGTRRRYAVDRGFVLSDHADWPSLLKTIQETKAKTILTTHGDSATLAKYLREEKQLDARELKGLDLIGESED